MVKDINPGRGGSDLTGITAVNRIIYFTADDGVHGAEGWRSDGTAKGTRMVKDINPGSGRAVILPTSPTPTAFSTSPRLTRATTKRALAKRRHRGGDDSGQAFPEHGGLPTHQRQRHPLLRQLRRFLLQDKLWRSDGTEGGDDLGQDPTSSTSWASPTSTGPSTSAPATPTPAATRCGEATAPRPARRWSRTSDPEAPSTSNQRQRAPSTSRLLSDRGPFPNEVWRSDGTGAGTTLIKQTQGGILRFYRHQREDRLLPRRRRRSGEATAPRKERPSSGETAPAEHHWLPRADGDR